MAMQQLSDLELLQFIQKRNSLAFSELVTRHTQTYYRLAFRFLNDSHQAEDVIQDAFIKLWENPFLWNEEKQTKFTTWFYKVIINRCLDQKRIKANSSFHTAIEKDLTDPSLSNEAQLIQAERQHRLEQLINTLPDRQRTALNLCFFEGLSNQEAADIMNLNLKALQSLIMRGKTNIKNKLNEQLK